MFIRQAQMLIHFLREHDAEKICLVGGIVDCWRVKRKGFYWPQTHNDVVQKLLRKARKDGAAGIVCGHIHHAANEMRAGVLYLNTGDWVESYTAIVEHHDGRLELIDWSKTVRDRAKRTTGTRHRTESRAAREAA